MPTTYYYTVNDEIIGEHTIGSSRLDYLPDALGSVVATIDQTLTVKSTARYKPYGADLTTTGTQPKYGHTGVSGSRRTSLQHSDKYNRARRLGSLEGRWTTVDPIWPYDQGYAYVDGCPTTLTDPAGLQRRERRHTHHCVPRQHCPCPNQATPAPDIMKCIDNALSASCPSNPVYDGGAGNYSDSLLRYIMYCIIQGESDGNPNDCTEISDPRSDQYGCLACGYVQITPIDASSCASLGYPNWATDGCQNIGCGVARLCKTLQDPATNGWIYSKKCKGLYNSIYMPADRFDNCLKNFSITLDHSNPKVGIRRRN